MFAELFSNWLNVYFNFSDDNFELAVVGKNAVDYARKINSVYCPNLILAGSEKKSNLPFLKNRFEVHKTMFYKCKNKTCALPTEDFDIFWNDLYS